MVSKHSHKRNTMSVESWFFLFFGPVARQAEFQAIPWATFGLIIAFQSTKKDGSKQHPYLSLFTTLGFVKSDPQDIRILDETGNRRREADIFLVAICCFPKPVETVMCY